MSGVDTVSWSTPVPSGFGETGQLRFRAEKQGQPPAGDHGDQQWKSHAALCGATHHGVGRNLGAGNVTYRKVPRYQRGD